MHFTTLVMNELADDQSKPVKQSTPSSNMDRIDKVERASTNETGDRFIVVR